MDDRIYDLADLFKIFSDSTRIRILYALMDGEKSVSEICEAVEMTQSAVSHQLKTLKSSHLVKVRRDGKAMLYSLADDHVETILKIGMEHIQEEE
ncbi:MAG: metalloregulator ArsR/SmtB family transcription factor [Lachnospiraceae bacterium]|nr:metalloregulator ArsR/SmtB family transcription factor [Lachnospiraceae bacterium]